MSPIAISVLAFALMLFGMVAGGWVQQRLPERHLSSDSKEVVKLSMGVMGTLTALVLGLLVASAQQGIAAELLSSSEGHDRPIEVAALEVPLLGAERPIEMNAVDAGEHQ